MDTIQCGVDRKGCQDIFAAIVDAIIRTDPAMCQEDVHVIRVCMEAPQWIALESVEKVACRRIEKRKRTASPCTPREVQTREVQARGQEEESSPLRPRNLAVMFEHLSVASDESL